RGDNDQDKTRDAQCLVYQTVDVTVLEAVADGQEDAQPGPEMRQARLTARRAQPLESIDQLVAFLTPAHHHRRQLPVTFQRPRHGSFGFRQVQAIASVVFADLLAFQLQQILVGPTLHKLTVIAAPGADQYVKLISD